MALKQLPNSHWFRIEQQSIHGTPDCLGVIRGNFVGIEFKSDPKAKITKLQEHALSMIGKAGGRAFLLHPDNWTEYFQELCAWAELGICKPDSGWFQ